MGRGEQRARLRNLNQSRQKAKRKLLLIGAGLLIIIVLGVFIIQNTQSYEYTELTSTRPQAGNPDAAVTVTEFSDLQCPACAAAHPVVVQLKEEYADQINFEFRHFPLRSIHPFAYEAAIAAECAHDKGVFWEYIDLVFVNQDAMTRSDLIRYGEIVGLNTEEFRSCLLSGAKEKYVQMDLQDGLRRNVQGTPTFFVNGAPVQGFSYNQLKAAIDAAIAQNAPVVEP